MKTCPTCKTIKEDSEFYKEKSTLDGLCFRCKACEIERSRAYRKKHDEIITERRLSYYKQNKQKLCKRRAKYRIVHKVRINKYSCRYHIRRRKEDVLFALKNRVSSNIRRILKRAFGTTKSKSTRKVLGCTDMELLEHLGISSIEELNGNHVDHICPISRAITEDEVYKLNHYSNLRIISAAENLAKSDSWTPEGAMLCLILLGREWLPPPTDIP